MHCHPHHPTPRTSTTARRSARLTACALCCAGLALSAEASAEVFQTIDGEVVIEAETFTRKAGSLNDWFFDDEMTGYWGTGYMEAGDVGTGLDFDPEKRRLEYDIVFNETGTYHIHLRTNALAHTENGFFATFDGAEADYAHGYYLHVPFAQNGNWRWGSRVGKYHNDPPVGPTTVRIHVDTPGLHTFALYMRETNARFDVVWLSQSQTTVLPNLPDPDLPDPAGFIIEYCANDADDDGDGAIDCADPDCDGQQGAEGEICEAVEESCGDGADNDRDELVDCADPDCDGDVDCQSGTGGAGGTSSGVGGQGASFGAGGGEDPGDPPVQGAGPSEDGCAVSAGRSSHGHPWLVLAATMLVVLGRRRPGSRAQRKVA